MQDIQASKAFYEKSGFTVFGGNAAHNWRIMKHGDHIIGLFQGMFEMNIISVNPGWDSHARKLPAFTGVRELQRQLKAQDVVFQTETGESTTGPASFVAEDTGGTPILVDQHI